MPNPIKTTKLPICNVALYRLALLVAPMIPIAAIVNITTIAIAIPTNGPIVVIIEFLISLML